MSHLQHATHIPRRAHPSHTQPRAERVAEGVAVLMRAIAGSGTAAAAPMREAALREGAMLHHLLLATATTSSAASAAASTNSARTLLSRDLVASWADEYAPALTLLRRVFPPGLIRFLNTPRPRQQPPPPPPQPATGASAMTSQSTATVQYLADGGANVRPAGTPPQDAISTGGATGASGDSAAPAGVAGTPTPAMTPLVSPRDGGASAPSAGQPSSQQVLSSTGVAPAGGDGQPGSGATATNEGADAAPGGGSVQPQPSASPPSLTPVASVVPPAAAPPKALHMPSGGGLRGNWEALWAALGRDHSHAGLVWNETCRRELRDALAAEESALR
jgi:DnaJ family protein C protein 13